jgi:hypothetical protein
MPLMPQIPDTIITSDDIKALVETILTHARGIQPAAKRRRCAAEFILRKLVEMGVKNRTPIQLENIMAACPGEVIPPPNDPMAAAVAAATARSLMKEVKRHLKHFFEEEPEGIKQRYYLEFPDVRNYLPVLRDRRSPVRADDFVAHFWRPHRALDHPATILFVEPQFFIDSNGTYLRNPGVNTAEQAAQLGIQGELKASYSFVPAGIVQAMLCVMRILRPVQPSHKGYPDTEVVKPWTGELPKDNKNLVVLATPTSTALVATLENGLRMRTTRTGVSLNDAANLLEDTSDIHGDSVRMVKWGVLTRRPPRYKDREVTLLAARHGRTVEAMAKFLTDPAQIPALAVQLQRQEFPPSFQALFRVEMTKTSEGPTIEAVYVDFAEPL